MGLGCLKVVNRTAQNLIVAVDTHLTDKVNDIAVFFYH